MSMDFKALLPREGEYVTFMQDRVEPTLERLRTEGDLTLYDGANLHFEFVLPPNARAAVVISHGFTESGEKFREMAYWFLQMGYAVFAMDHRGHGRSERIDPSRPYLTDVPSFSHYIKDLACFVTQIVRPRTRELPLYLYGHSMGGAIAAAFLERYPKFFAKAILNAPMMKPKTNGIPAPITRAMAEAFCLFGKSGEPVFVYEPAFNANERFADSPDDSEERFEYYRQKRVSFPYLQNSAPSYRWLCESLAIGKEILKAENCEKIAVPVLLFSAGNDTFVFRKEQEIFISRIKQGEIVYEERAKHEIYMATNEILADYLSKIEAFLEQR